MSYQEEGRIPVAREGELYSLKWHTFQSHFTSGLPNLLFDGDHLTDVTLVAEGRIIKSHRLLLSLCSPHFKQLFHANAGPNANTIVILNNVKFKDLEHVLQFIYNGEVKVGNNQELQGFLQTGELLQIEGLTQNSNAETDNHSSMRENEPVSANNIQISEPRVIPPPQPQMFRRSQANSGNSPVPVVAATISSSRVSSQMSTSLPSKTSLPQKTSHIPAKRPKFSTPVTATVTSSSFNNNNSITGDLNNSDMEVPLDPLAVVAVNTVGPTSENDPLMEELIGGHSRHGDEEDEEEQMIQIDSIKSEGEIYVHDDRSEEEEETFEVKDHADPGSISIDIGAGGGMYPGGAVSVDDLLNLPGPSSAITGAHLQPPKPPEDNYCEESEDKRRSKLKRWDKKQEFVSAEDAMQFLSSMNLWSKTMGYSSSNGDKHVLYRCKLGKKRVDECPLKLKLTYHKNSSKVSLFECGGGHRHPANRMPL